ncbi:MAG: class I SAM-dependent methyltransferase [Sphingomonadaceae bacterium]|nr:class I SAM-dependent methyltransferase [Sphingomonadaceae bacterium]
MDRPRPNRRAAATPWPIEDARLQAYLGRAFVEVHGWVGRGVIWSLEQIARFQASYGIVGESCEIGVHHGRFFLALENVTPEGMACHGVDVFDDQELNVDGSGQGSEAKFNENVAGYAIGPDRVRTVVMDSMSAEARGFFRGIEGRVALFSVDGGHTRSHAMTDLASAEVALAPGGVVWLDDFFNPNWPGATEGVVDYLRGPHRLRPVLAIESKLLLAGVSHADRIIAHLREAGGSTGRRVKTVSFCGYSFLSINRPIDRAT